MFIDEAHLLFENASKILLDRLTSVVKLIRSKGVGIYFCTQLPTDIPEEIVSQIGTKIQHALRAFSAKDRKAIKAMAENFPDSEFYEVDKILTELGTGEALLSTLDPKGRPTPLVFTHLRAPVSRMGTLSDQEKETILESSEFHKHYSTQVDRESAFELLGKKVENKMTDTEVNAVSDDEPASASSPFGKRTRVSKKKMPTEKSTLEKVSESRLVRDMGRTVAREMTRGLLGALGIKKTRKSTTRKKSSRKKSQSTIENLLEELF